MTYRDDAESVRAENARLRAEVEALKHPPRGLVSRVRTMESWETFALPVMVFGAPIMFVAVVAMCCDPRVGGGLAAVVLCWWGWAIFRLNAAE